MASKGDDLMDNYETYQAQLRQVEAALMIDDSNEELNKLKTDLLEVINLTKELLEINETPTEPEPVAKQETKWNPGDPCQAFKKSSQSYVDATIDMISDDGESCTVKFVNSNIVDVVKVASLQPASSLLFPSTSAPSATSGQSSSSKQSTTELKTEEGAAEAPTKKQKLTREEIERRKELKKKKLQKKKQKLKEFEEARELSKQKWQNFYKGSSKGKHKLKGVNKKSIFASSEDGTGKIGIGTCGTSGKTMTKFAHASQYMYKK